MQKITKEALELNGGLYESLSMIQVTPLNEVWVYVQYYTIIE